MRTLSPKSLSFTVLLGSLVTLASFATDMGLPVLAATAASLGVEAHTAALTLSVFMAGFAIGPVVMAPISDRYGRRPFLLLGCFAFAMFGALGAFATSLPALLLWRFIMGAGAGTVQVLVVATLRDHFTGAEARVRQSYVNLASGVAPIIAPTVGVYIASLGGWRAIYGALAGGGLVLFTLVALFLRERVVEATGELKTQLTVRNVLTNYARVFRNPISIGYALVVALCFGCLFAYVSGSSLVLIGVFGVSQKLYGALFAATSFGLISGSLINARLNRQGFSHRKLIAIGLSTILTLTLALLVLALLGRITPTILIALIIVSHVGHAVVRANSAQGALEPLPDIAGVASAVITGLQMVIGATSSAIAAALFDGHSAIAMTGTMSVCAIGAVSVYLLVVRPAERKGQGAATGSGVITEEFAVVGVVQA